VTSFVAFDPQRFLRELRQAGCSLGEPFHFEHETDSTNDDAKRAARGGVGHGAVFLAEAQRRGRGRQGKSWHAEPGQSLLFSVVLRPRLSAERLSALTLAIGLGVRAALAEEVPSELRIKWPNDVLAGEHKLAGVLLESAGQLQEPAVIAGIGINVLGTSFPTEVQARAVSLQGLGVAPCRELLLVNTLRRIEFWVRRLEAQDLASIVSELSRWDALRGRTLSVEGVTGTAVGIDAQGRLLLDVQGRVVPIQSGTVELLPKT
jgi:BirA family transcriptional regulator, biotin operon repressor / biotin---[acetyl-CoA-carboxylase] ligase